MATGDLTPRSNDSLAMLTQLLTTFKGSATTTNTSSETVSDAKTKAMLEQLLSGTGGLAAVSGGQKAAGIYNSTVNTQLTNDLLSRASAQVASASSVKTTTQSTGAQVNPLGALGTLVGGQIVGKLGAPILTAAKKKFGITGGEDVLTNTGNTIADAIFGGGGGTPALAPFSADMAIYPAAFDKVAVNDAALQNVSDLGDLGGGGSGISGTGAAAGLAGAGIAAGLAGGASAGATAGGYAIAAGDTAFGLTAGAAAAEVGASAAAGAAGSAAAGAGLSASLGEAAAVGGPIALAALAISEGSKALGIKEVPHWIICTELNRQRRLPNKYYVHGLKVFDSYSEKEKQGYFLWAIPCTYHLRTNPYSTWSRFMCYVFNVRAEHISAMAGMTGAKRSVMGAVTEYIGRRVCRILGNFCASRDYTVVYTNSTGSF